MGAITVLSPVAAAAAVGVGDVARLDGLTGRSVAIVGNGWRSWAALREPIRAALVDEHGVTGVELFDVPLGEPAPEEVLRDVAKADAAVVGLANCGSCAVATARNARWLADNGVAVLVAATQRYAGMVASLAGELPLVNLPADLEQFDDGRLATLAAELPRQIATHLGGRAR
ncbi:hypothetical protein GCM10009836_01610 [Pseudonocardia ailaonensis]|uniref:UGSC-like domain-containing protein n=1 Tax=Pseudonocardia ailaonensis TaxID=367279 RepID=A0ABN2MIF0_9PSEU